MLYYTKSVGRLHIHYIYSTQLFLLYWREILKMPVWLHNLQSQVVFNQHLLKLHCGFLLHVLGMGRWDVSVVCVGREEIQALNQSYRKVDAPTDVLSFPYHEVLLACMSTCHSYSRSELNVWPLVVHNKFKIIVQSLQ